MGAVRIYKHVRNDEDYWPWQIRTGGCAVVEPSQCDFGIRHEGYCNSLTYFSGVISYLNNPSHELGAYLKK